MNTDQLSELMERFSLRAGVFYNGAFCGIVRFNEGQEQHGHIHLLRRGNLTMHMGDGRTLVVSGPRLLYCPRALVHRFDVDEADDVELTCASIHIESGLSNPVTRSIPDIVILGTDEVPNAGPLLDWLVAEAVQPREGQVAVLNRLFELVIIEVLRHLMSRGQTASGLLAGLADARIAKALEAVHARPQAAWTIESMADAAGMSRARFAAHFRAVVQITPLDYLTDWRLTLAQQMLIGARPMKLIAGDVGYDSPSALARAFRRRLGCSPQAWLRARRAGQTS